MLAAEQLLESQAHLVIGRALVQSIPTWELHAHM